jgi:hypothetical protein
MYPCTPPTWPTLMCWMRNYRKWKLSPGVKIAKLFDLISNIFICCSFNHGTWRRLLRSCFYSYHGVSTTHRLAYSWFCKSNQLRMRRCLFKILLLIFDYLCRTLKSDASDLGLLLKWALFQALSIFAQIQSFSQPCDWRSLTNLKYIRSSRCLE